MRIWMCLVWVAACGGKASGEDVSGGSNKVAQAPGDAGVADAATAPVAPPHQVEAPPGGTIVHLAVTPANDAALTVDDANEVRLWPTLDGKRAPLAVELPAASLLALQRNGAEFVAVLGVAGGALHVRIDGTGKRTAVVELPPIDGVVANGAGFVTWRGKHVEWLDAAGVVTRSSDSEAAPAAPPTTVTAKDSDLVIRGADGPRYLGYAFPLLNPPTGSDPGHLAVPGPDNRWLQVTSELFPVGNLAPWTPKGETATALTWLGDHDWLVDVPSGVVLWTEGAAAGTITYPKASVAAVDLESHLVLLSDKHLARYVPAKHALEPVAFKDWGDESAHVRLVSPSANHGAVLVVDEWSRDTNGVEHSSARWIRDLEHPERGMTRWTGDEEWPLAISQGRALVINHRAQHWKIVVDGVSEGEIPTDVSLSADRSTMIRTHDDLVELAKRAGGATIWTVPTPGTGAMWHTGAFWMFDQIWMVQPHGIALLDAVTGAVVRVAEGWRFELGRAPHPVSTLGRPLAVELAPGRDKPLVLAADTAFQKLARDTAKASHTEVMWWGPVRFEDKQLRRCAFFQSPDINGTALFAILVEMKPGSIVAVTAQSGGFPDFQGPFRGRDPVWGTIRLADDSPAKSTLDAAPFKIGSKWIHMSNEYAEFTLERDRFVLLSDSWLERENTGNPEHRYEETSGGDAFPPGKRPALAGYHGHTTYFAVSKPSNSADELALGIHTLTD